MGTREDNIAVANVRQCLLQILQFGLSAARQRSQLGIPDAVAMEVEHLDGLPAMIAAVRSDRLREYIETTVPEYLAKRRGVLGAEWEDRDLDAYDKLWSEISIYCGARYAGIS